MNNQRKKYEWFGNENKIFDYAIPIVLGICALLIRGPGLGKWCITIDEFFFSQPVAFIIEKGIPELPGGGYYTRGILLQYMTVFPVLAFKKWEFAIRIIPLTLGVLTIPLFYIVCRLFLPTFPSFLSSIILLLSSWHIEFSRFARFYTPFQFLFFLFLYLFYVGYWKNKHRHNILSWLIAFVSILIYEGAIFLPFILFLTILKDGHSEDIKKKNLNLIYVSAFLLLSNFLINRYEWWFLKIINPLPSTISNSLLESPKTFPIELPDMHLFSYIITNWFSLISFILLIFIAVIIYMKEQKYNRTFLFKSSIIITLFFPIIHLYCVSLFSLTIVSLFREEIKTYFLKNKNIWISYFFITAIYWIVIIYLSGNGNKILHLTIGYPPIKKTIIEPLYENVPLWGSLILITLVFSIFTQIVWKRKESTSFILAVILYLIFIMSTFKTLWKSTRYIFFFYPLFIILLYSELQILFEWVRKKYQNSMSNIIKYCFALIPLVLFGCTEDFNLYQILNVSSKETNFRMGKYEKLSNHWYYRVDLESPVKYVNKAYKAGDVIVLDEVSMSRYLEKPYINYVDISDDIRFKYHARNEGKIEKWSGRPLIYSENTFVNYIPKNLNHSLWLISSIKGGFIGSSFVQKNQTPIDIAERHNINVDLKYIGIDNRIGVWEFKRKNSNNSFIKNN